ncbi:MAG: T9SS type A sorting domain-containing protein [Calditrichaeota bacterium]|nr:T9SS type A sorting domain-containing protein [Calditrichota bacterium]
MKIFKFMFAVSAILLIVGFAPKTAHAWCDPGEIACGSVIDTNIWNGHSDVSKYRNGSNGPYCTPGGFSDAWNGRAHVYRLYHAGGRFTAVLEWDDNPTTPNDDLIMVLLRACDRYTCEAADPTTIDIEDLAADTYNNGNNSDGYWLIVDSRTRVNKDYTLRVFCGDFPFSVELMSFDAERVNGGVDLNWSTASELENDHFEITRREIGTDVWSTVGIVGASGTTSSQTNYSYTDRSVSDAGFVYQLLASDINGNIEVVGTADVAAATPSTAIASEFALVGNYPNPFNPTTNIRFTVADASEITISVYDVQGRLVADLFNGSMEAGVHEIAFNADGLTSGVYFTRMSGAFGSDVMKMVLMK